MLTVTLTSLEALVPMMALSKTTVPLLSMFIAASENIRDLTVRVAPASTTRPCLGSNVDLYRAFTSAIALVSVALPTVPSLMVMAPPDLMVTLLSMTTVPSESMTSLAFLTSRVAPSSTMILPSTIMDAARLSMMSLEPFSMVTVTPSLTWKPPLTVTVELFLIVRDPTTVTFSSCP